ncbi:NUDIX hydrolase [Parvularcula sp. IMCC14364]|uniref:NUDIX hydrolase n=1 Tax=Parvularcula sp. IMCC14364 TaxID=3067902 RepID=UPI00274110B7|nr:NUDIX hydrolase [Parvularcula sp. IMCC14364]
MTTDNLEPEFARRVPEDDNMERSVCTRCGFIDYQNPKIVVGSVAVAGEQILLCKRAIEPRKSFWTLPAGFMELKETLEEAAMREAQEEACAELAIDRVLATYSVPHISQVQIMFRARLINPETIAAGPESEAVGLFNWSEIPWTDLAFPSVYWALKQYDQSKDNDDFAPFTNPPGGL